MPKPTVFWAGCPEFMGYLEGRREEFLEALLSMKGEGWDVIEVREVYCHEAKLLTAHKPRSPKEWSPGFQWSHLIAPPKVTLDIDINLRVDKSALEMLPFGDGGDPTPEYFLPHTEQDEVARQALEAFTSLYGAVPVKGARVRQELFDQGGWIPISVKYIFGRE